MVLELKLVMRAILSLVWILLMGGVWRCRTLDGFLMKIGGKPLWLKKYQLGVISKWMANLCLRAREAEETVTFMVCDRPSTR